MVLEVGCGPGTDVFEMAHIVGTAGRLVGVDASEAMIAEARHRAGERQIAATFEVGDVEALPFWWEYLQDADEHGTLLIGYTTFIVVGVRS